MLMPLFLPAPPLYVIPFSVLVDGDDYFKQTFSVDRRSTKWTLAFWFKHGQVGTQNQNFFSDAIQAGTTIAFDSWNAQDEIAATMLSAGSRTTYPTQYVETTKFHLMNFRYDSTQANENDRLIFEYDGSRVTFSTVNTITQNSSAGSFGAAVEHQLFARLGTSTARGYFADLRFINTLSVASSDLASGTGANIKPKKYTGSYPAGSFYLDFADNTNMGKDVSGNGLHFTTVGAPVRSTTTPTS